ncbi:VOC family protein [Myxosarcina sp. GI1]|uniref:VOC family protein n=1 Tax=Myxosarcina sp. GI1 TaxID=1541065 RepID=UPI00056A1A30|nr:VOC family protein [Myxosarcina sp. GI1]
MNITYKGTRLLVCDYQACLDFYQKILEFDLIYEGDTREEADLRLGNTMLNLIKRQSMAKIIGSRSESLPVERQDNLALIFTTPNLEDTCSSLKEKGVSFETQPMYRPDWGIKTIYLRDPDRNLIGIYELTG